MHTHDDLKTHFNFEIGVSGYFHDSSVALFQNGILIDFIKEEDILRIKGASGFPFKALEYLRDQYKLTNQNIKSVCFYEKPLKSWLYILKYILQKNTVSYGFLKKHLQNFWDGPLSFQRNFCSIIKLDRSKIFYSDHHASHIMSALPFLDNFSRSTKSLNFTFDAFGDGLSSTVSIFDQGKLNLIHSNEFPNSLGLFYSTFTQFCGFLPNEGEYKLMALAGYGQPIYLDFILDELMKVDGPNYKLNLDYFSFDTDDTQYFSAKFSDKFRTLSGSDFHDSTIADNNLKHFADIASSAQAALEYAMTESIKWAIKATGIQDITISGGVAQNCLAVSKIASANGIRSIIVPPSPGDSGAAIGAVNYVRLINGDTIEPIDALAFGAVADQFLPSEDLFDLVTESGFIREAATLIDQGEIISIFDGRRELGPRALGYRSIICDAGNGEVISKLNTMIKKREQFRPLAPAALAENADRLFDIDPKLRKNLNWMGAVCYAKPDFEERYRFARHIDNSARLQIISDDSGLIYKVAQKTQTKLLINTSFNIASDPIVFDYIDVFVNMTRMDLKYLLTPRGLFSIKPLEL